jgi:hypothetical protein
MNARLYDPVLGRMLSPDNEIHPEAGLNGYNRYSYALNNPLKFTDPDGNIPIIAAIIIGAIVNVAIQGFSGNIKNIKDYGLALGIGAAAGGLSAVTGGAAAGLIGCGGFLGGAAVGATSGFTAGFITGTGNSWSNGESFWNGLKVGFHDALIGGLSGAVMGGIVSGIDALNQDCNFWTGRLNEVGGGGSGRFLDESIPAGAKPTATGEVARTNSNPNYGKYGHTRNGGAKAHYGVDYAGEEGEDVFAMYKGTVTKIGGSKDYGKHFVRTSSLINGKTYNVDYGHMSMNTVSVKDVVSAGQKIGELGRLGNLANTTFPTHVHISVWRPVGSIQGFVMPSWK